MTSLHEGSTVMLSESPSLTNSAETLTTSPKAYHPLSGASTMFAFTDISEPFARALGATTANRPASNIASVRSLPMVNHRRHPLEVMRFMRLVSEDGRMHTRD